MTCPVKHILYIAWVSIWLLREGSKVITLGDRKPKELEEEWNFEQSLSVKTGITNDLWEFAW